jgi:ribosome-associated protein
MGAGAMLWVSDELQIAPEEITETHHRASGPGGQRVNKVATAVAIRFEAARSPSLDSATKARLRQIAGRKWTTDGAVILGSQRFRSQARNREDALADLIRRASQKPRRRVATRPSRGAKERRLAAKAGRSAIKVQRKPVRPED